MGGCNTPDVVGGWWSSIFASVITLEDASARYFPCLVMETTYYIFVLAILHLEH